MKKLLAIVLVVALLATGSGVALAAKDVTGNGAPSGSHFNLNLIGVKDDKAKNENMGCGEGHRIFVKLGEPKKNGQPGPSTTRIYLKEGEFAVIDCDGTDGRAEFQLPNPDPGKTGCTKYSVYIRPLGKPNGSAVITTCATDPLTGEEICSIEPVELERKAGKSRFVNVSKELLTICALVCTEVDPITGDCIAWEWMRLYLFDPLLEDYLWKYDNNGLKLVQLRFYEQETCYSAAEWDCPPAS